ncbi:MAG TPA: septum formation initiator family protein [Firmicutes bacterium]|nr:septum formation initiator family protein [Candidatus Fermentithermobacillaceae bacterium]
MIRSASAESMGIRRAVLRRSRRTRSVGVPVEILGLLYFIIILGAGLLLVWQPAKVAEITSQINKLEATLQDVKLRNEDLKKTVAAMESLSYIEAEARNRLGMVDPTEVRTCEILEVTPAMGPGISVASNAEPKQTGIMAVWARITQIFGSREAIAKGK